MGGSAVKPFPFYGAGQGRGCRSADCAAGAASWLRDIDNVIDVEAESCPELSKVHPGVEVYRIDGPDAENQIDRALLNDLACPLNLAFGGGEDAGRFAGMYRGIWIEAAPGTVAKIQRVWGAPEPGAPT
jgi:hypothetical protein